MVLLDTDILIGFLRNNKEAVSKISKLLAKHIILFTTSNPASFRDENSFIKISDVFGRRYNICARLADFKNINAFARTQKCSRVFIETGFEYDILLYTKGKAKPS